MIAFVERGILKDESNYTNYLKNLMFKAYHQGFGTGGSAASRNATSINFWGCQTFPCEDFLSVTFCFSYSSSPMVLGLVNCLAEVHSTTVFALRNGKCSIGGAPIPP